MKKILFPARGLNPDRCTPQQRLRAELLALSYPAEWIMPVPIPLFICRRAVIDCGGGRATVVCGFFAYKKNLGRTETPTRERMYLGRIRSVKRHLPKRLSKNCDLEFANVDRLMANYSIDNEHNLTFLCDCHRVVCAVDLNLLSEGLHQCYKG